MRPVTGIHLRVNVRYASNIKVVLLDNSIPKLGQKGEIVVVKRGYARNLLIPRKIAGKKFKKIS